MKIFNYKRVPYAEMRAFSVHILTASGSFLAFLGVVAAAEHRFIDMFWWLGLALLVDGIDGPIARKVRVKEVLPNWSGDTLDNIIDYVTYVLLPAFALYQSGMIGEPWSFVAAGMIVVSSAIYYADMGMKTDEYFFSGFPVVWNMIVFTLFVIDASAVTALSVVTVSVILTFLPINFLHPVRVKRLRPLNLGIFFLWSALGMYSLLMHFDMPQWARCPLRHERDLSLLHRRRAAVLPGAGTQRIGDTDDKDAGDRIQPQRRPRSSGICRCRSPAAVRRRGADQARRDRPQFHRRVFPRWHLQGTASALRPGQGSGGHRHGGWTGRDGFRRSAIGSPMRAPTAPIAPNAISRRKHLVNVPDGIGLETAAAMMLKGMTAEYLLNRTFKVGPQTVLLFHAAAGGVGLIAGQWAKALGATVIGTAGSEDKVKLALAHGYDHVINYRTESFRRPCPGNHRRQGRGCRL